ncbi:minor capsid protein [Streptomyces sp. NPDC051940]|uniref:minor capsid protein n=1 Tax=Streptomyces sp. NPDC051940 TaxID=3155675 RepID=UPI0034243E15
MADVLEGLALHLTSKGLATYNPAAAGGDCFLEAMPSTPGLAVVLTGYGGPESDSANPYDEPRVQIRVRGAADPRVSRSRAEAIRSELHGLGPLILPDGTHLILAIAMQAAPASMGRDEAGRFEHVVNYRCTVRQPTAHRG